jgi:hypothetical protein
VQLVLVEGMTYREAAEVIGCSEGTVRSRLNRARGICAEASPIMPRMRAQAGWCGFAAQGCRADEPQIDALRNPNGLGRRLARCASDAVYVMPSPPGSDSERILRDAEAKAEHAEGQIRSLVWTEEGFRDRDRLGPA